MAFIFNTISYDLAWALKAPADLPATAIPAPDSNDGFKDLKASTFILPQNLGTIRDCWQPDSHKSQVTSHNTIIHIQDAHCNYAAQHKIEEIIEYLHREYGIGTINLEGGSSDYDLSIFTNINDKIIRDNVSDHFVKEGLVNGAEYYAINNPDKIKLWGIEDASLYIENLKIYRNSLKHKEDIDRYLGSLNYAISNLKRHIYSKELMEFDSRYMQYKSGKMEFREYLGHLAAVAKKNLIDIKQFTNIYLLSQTLGQEEGIDFKAANNERDLLIDSLQRRMSRKSLEELVAKTVEFKSEKLSQEDFYKYLAEKARNLGMDLADFPELQKYTVYISTYSVIDKARIMTEVDLLEDRIKEALYQNDKDRELDRLSKNLTLTRNLFNISLTRDDYRYYKDNEDSFSIKRFVTFIGKEAPLYNITAGLDENVNDLDGWRGEMAQFYEYSFKRDKVFLKNIRFEGPNHKVAIVVTGGFHSENLCELFRKQNIPYISIMPSFKNDDKYECPYFKLLGGTRQPEDVKIGRLFGLSDLALASILNHLGEQAYGKEEYIISRLKIHMLSARLSGKKGIKVVHGKTERYFDGDWNEVKNAEGEFEFVSLPEIAGLVLEAPKVAPSTAIETAAAPARPEKLMSVAEFLDTRTNLELGAQSDAVRKILIFAAKNIPYKVKRYISTGAESIVLEIENGRVLKITLNDLRWVNDRLGAGIDAPVFDRGTFNVKNKDGIITPVSYFVQPLLAMNVTDEEAGRAADSIKAKGYDLLDVGKHQFGRDDSGKIVLTDPYSIEPKGRKERRGIVYLDPLVRNSMRANAEKALASTRPDSRIGVTQYHNERSVIYLSVNEIRKLIEEGRVAADANGRLFWVSAPSSALPAVVKLGKISMPIDGVVTKKEGVVNKYGNGEVSVYDTAAGGLKDKDIVAWKDARPYIEADWLELEKIAEENGLKGGSREVLGIIVDRMRELRGGAVKAFYDRAQDKLISDLKFERDGYAPVDIDTIRYKLRRLALGEKQWKIFKHWQLKQIDGVWYRKGMKKISPQRAKEIEAQISELLYGEKRFEDRYVAMPRTEIRTVRNPGNPDAEILYVDRNGITRCMRLNEIQIKLSEKGIFYKGDTPSEYKGPGANNSDQYYPHSPREFWDEHIKARRIAASSAKPSGTDMAGQNTPTPAGVKTAEAVFGKLSLMQAELEGFESAFDSALRECGINAAGCRPGELDDIKRLVLAKYKEALEAAKGAQLVPVSPSSEYMVDSGGGLSREEILAKLRGEWRIRIDLQKGSLEIRDERQEKTVEPDTARHVSYIVNVKTGEIRHEGNRKPAKQGDLGYGKVLAWLAEMQKGVVPGSGKPSGTDMAEKKATVTTLPTASQAQGIPETIASYLQGLKIIDLENGERRIKVPGYSEFTLTANNSNLKSLFQTFGFRPHDDARLFVLFHENRPIGLILDPSNIKSFDVPAGLPIGCIALADPQDEHVLARDKKLIQEYFKGSPNGQMLIDIDLETGSSAFLRKITGKEGPALIGFPGVFATDFTSELIVEHSYPRIKKGDRVLVVGCGRGVDVLAASLSDASSVDAIDLSELEVQNTMLNLKRWNEGGKRWGQEKVRVINNTGLEGLEKYDVIIFNAPLIYNGARKHRIASYDLGGQINLDFLSKLREHLTPSGFAIYSNEYSEENAPILEDAFEQFGLHADKLKVKDVEKPHPRFAKDGITMTTHHVVFKLTAKPVAAGQAKPTGTDMAGKREIAEPVSSAAGAIPKKSFSQTQPLIPAGWTYLAHGTNLIRREWNNKYNELYENDTFTVGPMGLSVITREDQARDIEIFGKGHSTTDGYSLGMRPRGMSDEEFAARNKSVEIRIIFFQDYFHYQSARDSFNKYIGPLAEAKRCAKILEDISVYYFKNIHGGRHPLVPRETILTKVAHVVENGKDVFYFIPQDFKDLYEQQIRQETEPAKPTGTDMAGKKISAMGSMVDITANVVSGRDILRKGDAIINMQTGTIRRIVEVSPDGKISVVVVFRDGKETYEPPAVGSSKKWIAEIGRVGARILRAKESVDEKAAVLKEFNDLRANGTELQIYSEDNAYGRAASYPDLANMGFAPAYKIPFGEEAYYLSEPFIAQDGRLAFVSYFYHVPNHGEKPKLFVNGYYKSNSHAVWRVVSHMAPGWFGKGLGQDHQTLPIEIQSGLEQIIANASGLKSYNGIFEKILGWGGRLPEGSQLNTQFSYRRIIQERLVVAQEISLKGKDAGLQSHKFTFDENLKPDFRKGIIGRFESRNPIYGRVTHYQIKSVDGRIQYLFNVDEAGRAWIGTVQMAEDGLDRQGVRENRSAIIIPDILLTPAFQYISEMPEGYIGPIHPNPQYGKSYCDASVYLDQIDIIREFKRDVLGVSAGRGYKGPGNGFIIGAAHKGNKLLEKIKEMVAKMEATAARRAVRPKLAQDIRDWNRMVGALAARTAGEDANDVNRTLGLLRGIGFSDERLSGLGTRILLVSLGDKRLVETREGGSAAEGGDTLGGLIIRHNGVLKIAFPRERLKALGLENVSDINVLGPEGRAVLGDLLHELLEIDLMEKGMGVDEAHWYASRVSVLFTKKGPAKAGVLLKNVRKLARDGLRLGLFEKHFEEVMPEVGTSIFTKENLNASDLGSIADSKFEKFRTEFITRLEKDGWYVSDRFKDILKMFITRDQLKDYLTKVGHFDRMDLVLILQRLHTLSYDMSKFSATPEMLDLLMRYHKLSVYNIIIRVCPTVFQKREVLRRLGLAGSAWNSLQPNTELLQKWEEAWRFIGDKKWTEAEQAIADVRQILASSWKLENGKLQEQSLKNIKTICGLLNVDISAVTENMIMNQINRRNKDGIFVERSPDEFVAISNYVSENIKEDGLLMMLDEIVGLAKNGITIKELVYRGADSVVLKGVDHNGEDVMVKITPVKEGKTAERMFAVLDDVVRRTRRNPLFADNEFLYIGKNKNCIVEVDKFVKDAVSVKDLVDHPDMWSMSARDSVIIAANIIKASDFLINGLKVTDRDIDHIENLLFTSDGIIKLVDFGQIVPLADITEAGYLEKYKNMVILTALRVLCGQMWWLTNRPADKDEIMKLSKEMFLKRFGYTEQNRNIADEVFAALRSAWDSDSPDLNALANILAAAFGNISPYGTIGVPQAPPVPRLPQNAIIGAAAGKSVDSVAAEPSAKPTATDMAGRVPAAVQIIDGREVTRRGFVKVLGTVAASVLAGRAAAIDRPGMPAAGIAAPFEEVANRVTIELKKLADSFKETQGLESVEFWKQKGFDEADAVFAANIYARNFRKAVASLNAGVPYAANDVLRRIAESIETERKSIAEDIARGIVEFDGFRFNIEERKMVKYGKKNLEILFVTFDDKKHDKFTLPTSFYSYEYNRVVIIRTNIRYIAKELVARALSGDDKIPVWHVLGGKDITDAIRLASARIIRKSFDGRSLNEKTVDGISRIFEESYVLHETAHALNAARPMNIPEIGEKVRSIMREDYARTLALPKRWSVNDLIIDTARELDARLVLLNGKTPEFELLHMLATFPEEGKRLDGTNIAISIILEELFGTNMMRSSKDDIEKLKDGMTGFAEMNIGALRTKLSEAATRIRAKYSIPETSVKTAAKVSSLAMPVLSVREGMVLKPELTVEAPETIHQYIAANEIGKGGTKLTAAALATKAVGAQVLPAASHNADTEFTSALTRYEERVNKAIDRIETEGGLTPDDYLKAEDERIEAYDELFEAIEKWVAARGEKTGLYIYPVPGPDLIPLARCPTLRVEKDSYDFNRGLYRLKRLSKYSGDAAIAGIMANDIAGSAKFSGERDAMEIENYDTSVASSGAKTLILKGFTRYIPPYTFEDKKKDIENRMAEVLRAILSKVDRVLVLDTMDLRFMEDHGLLDAARDIGFSVTGPRIENLFEGKKSEVNTNTGEPAVNKVLLVPDAVFILEKTTSPSAAIAAQTAHAGIGQDADAISERLREVWANVKTGKNAEAAALLTDLQAKGGVIAFWPVTEPSKHVLLSARPVYGGRMETPITSDGYAYLARVISKINDVEEDLGMITYRDRVDLSSAGEFAARELVTNMWKYAESGFFVMHYVFNKDGKPVGFRLTAIDKGGGIGDVANALEFGTSASGTQGRGLPYLNRKNQVYTHNLNIDSVPGYGTIIYVDIYSAPTFAIPSATVTKPAGTDMAKAGAKKVAAKSTEQNIKVEALRRFISNQQKAGPVIFRIGEEEGYKFPDGDGADLRRWEEKRSEINKRLKIIMSELPVVERMEIDELEEGEAIESLLLEVLGNSYDAIVSFYDSKVGNSERAKSYEGLIELNFELDEGNNELVINVLDNGMGKKAATTDRKRFLWDNVGMVYMGGAGNGMTSIKDILDKFSGSYHMEFGAKTRTTIRIPLRSLKLKERKPAPQDMAGKMPLPAVITADKPGMRMALTAKTLAAIEGEGKSGIVKILVGVPAGADFNGKCKSTARNIEKGLAKNGYGVIKAETRGLMSVIPDERQIFTFEIYEGDAAATKASYEAALATIDKELSNVPAGTKVNIVSFMPVTISKETAGMVLEYCRSKPGVNGTEIRDSYTDCIPKGFVIPDLVGRAALGRLIVRAREMESLGNEKEAVESLKAFLAGISNNDLAGADTVDDILKKLNDEGLKIRPVDYEGDMRKWRTMQEATATSA